MEMISKSKNTVKSVEEEDGGQLLLFLLMADGTVGCAIDVSDAADGSISTHPTISQPTNSHDTHGHPSSSSASPTHNFQQHHHYYIIGIPPHAVVG